MSRSILTVFILPALLLIGSSSHNSAAREKGKSGDAQIETIEKLVVANGSATIELDLNRLSPIGPAADQSDLETLRFTLASDSYFTILATNDVFRTLNPGSIALLPQNAANLPALLSNSLHQLVLEKTPSDSAYDLMVRDSKTGFVFFNATGHHYDYDGATHSFSITDASLLISEEFTKQLGLPRYSREVVGKVSLRASMSPIEIQTVVNGEVQSLVMPPVRKQNNGEPDVVTSVPGPDVIVGDLPAIQQPSSTSGINGSFVGLGIATTSCNNGQQEFNWFANPNNDHPVIPQNLYRMSGGASNNDRFEQIGQSWLKHAFTALQENACGFGCTPAANGTHLGVGCSDPYSASLNYSQGTGLSQSGLGSRAWVNPFTGFYPRNDSTTPPNNHTGHVHTGTAHRVTVAMSDLIPASNPGATYFGEAQYVTPHEYAWCQAHPGECNMYNNVSYRRFTVATTNNTNFTFATAGSTVRMQPAIKAWTGATVNQFEPAPGVDGIGFLGYKVTNPSPGVWHYEYAVLNQNLDRAVQSFSVPVIAGANISNIGFRAPLQEPGWAADGTVGNTGFSSTPWNTNQAGGSLTWSSETFAQNQNANAIRWGTLYNFRFDSDAAPQTTVATLGFFKTGSPITVAIQAPGVQATPTPTPTLTPTPTPSPTPSPTPTPTPTPSPVISISGNIVYCSNPNLDPVPGVLLTLTGDASGSTSTDVAGNYTLSSIPAGGNYTVTPSVAPLLPGSTGVDTVDVIAVQRHFLNLGTPLSGCKLTAADVNGTAGVDTVDVVAIQRFFLGLTSGVANVGKCQFNPLNRAYSTVVTNQTGQNYDALIFGDVAVGFVYRQEGGNDASAGTLQIAPASPSLPNDTIAAAVTDFIKPVTTTPIEADANLVGFQGDFTFDELVVTFQTEPVHKAGLTSGNWNVSGNVLVGPGPIRTLRVSAYSTDFTPLKGSGTLFELRMTRVSSTPGAVTELVWAAPPHNFIFIDKNLQQLTIAPDSVEPAKKN